MKILLLTFILIVTVFPVVSEARFFENSTRRTPTFEEGRSIIRLNIGDNGRCTGFFISNNQSKIYIGTQRHCVPEHNLTQACKEGLIKLWYWHRQVGSCLKVIKESVEHDFAIFEAEIDYDIDLVKYKSPNGLALSLDRPLKGEPLQVIGYPSDSFRNSAITVSENCWVTVGSSTKIPSHHIGRPYKFTYSQYNCTVWTGNSGGPIIYPGKDIAIGVPSAASLDYSIIKSDDTEADESFFEPISDFVKKYKQILEEAGIYLERS